MPLMLPDIPAEQIRNEGEQAVFKALKEQLPQDWIVRHDFLFCRRRSGRLSPDGQVDFIVVIPGEGLLFLEVKGIRNATFCSDSGRCYWRQADGEIMETDDPFAQAQGNKHDVIRMLREDLRLDGYFPGRYGHAIVFPFAKSKGSLPGSHEPQVVFLHEDMSRLEDACRDALRQFGSEDIGARFTPTVQKRVGEWLRDRIELSPVAAVDMDEDERRIEALTRSQHEAYLGILENARVRVEGVAGSGKTLIALWTAQSVADSGERVLLLCFNKALAAWLRGQCPRLDVYNFHHLASKLCGKAGVPFDPNDSTADFWTLTAPVQAMSAIDNLGDEIKYDVILVDEAQDFNENWWPPVEMLLRAPESRLHVFLDPDQAGVYGYGQSYPCSSLVYRLGTNCRNTRSIAQASGGVIGKAITSKAGAPEGVQPSILDVEPDVRRRAQRVSSLIVGLLNDGLRPQDIAILSPWAIENEKCSLRFLGKVNGIAVQSDVTRLAEWRKGECFWGSTVKAFKGLEARCVVLTDVPAYCPPAFDRSDLYVAATRAKLRLYYLPLQEEAAGLLNQKP